MSQIRVNDLSFTYEGSFEPVFEHTSFSIDTCWKLGFIGRNGKGKTTFLRLLSGKYPYTGTIDTQTVFDYFPYHISPEDRQRPAAEFAETLKPLLGLSADILYRPFSTLSFGEQTKLMLALLFSGENDFLLIDEPTNHLDQTGRDSVKTYLAKKKGFILVSHDRDLLDTCIDHVLVLNRHTIEVQAGNFSSWWENKRKKDQFAQSENEKHRKEIARLKSAASQVKQWAEKSGSKRAYIGAKTKKMQNRVKQMEERIAREIEQKHGLLQDIEAPVQLKIMPLTHEKTTLIAADNYSFQYQHTDRPLIQSLSFSIQQGDRVILNGTNGCGKSSLIRAVLQKLEPAPSINWTESGSLRTASGLIVSYVNQDTSFLRGNLKAFCEQKGLPEPIFCALLRQLDMERSQFLKPMEEYSEGQKKKVLLAASLLTPAHLYIWDEPLNYIDIFSRMQIENLILTCRPTMLVVEHDTSFREKIGTKTIEL